VDDDTTPSSPDVPDLPAPPGRPDTPPSGPQPSPFKFDPYTGAPLAPPASTTGPATPGPPKGPGRSRRRVILIAAAVAVAIIVAVTAVLASQGGSPHRAVSQLPSPSLSPPAFSYSPPAFSYSPPPPTPDPEGKFTHACDYILGDFTDYTPTGYRFIAGANVRNTGNVGIVVRVFASWRQLGTSPITDARTVRVPYGESRNVNFTKDVSSNNIDLIQAALGNGPDCSVKVTIISSFGVVHG
jgi:hypothetical protein